MTEHLKRLVDFDAKLQMLLILADGASWILHRPNVFRAFVITHKIHIFLPVPRCIVEMVRDRPVVTLSLRFNGHFPGEPGLAGVYWSRGWWRWWWQLDYRYCSYKSCKAPVKSSAPANQHPVFSTGRMPFLSPNQQCQSTEGKISHFMDFLTPCSPEGLPTLSLTTDSSWLPWGGLPCLSSALWCQYTHYGTLIRSHGYPINQCQFRWPWVTLNGGMRGSSVSGRSPCVHSYRLINSDQTRHNNPCGEVRVCKGSGTDPVRRGRYPAHPSIP